ncbi:MAG: hypothetical protein EOP42_24775 [Sphingobacteriaceae bacterium]|nr:MAG: hypothetical protein EOP42_24775 [Sphingobacteriaceae bacterium]
MMKNEQTKQISTFPKAEWKIWLWGIILFLFTFIVIKTVSKFNTNEEVTETVAKFNEVDVLPSFPGGERAFGNYLQRNIHVSKKANGRVIAAFVVSKNGSIKDVKILRGLNAEADQEVIRVLEQSPNWNPGRQKGKAVNVAYTMPVNFTR